MGRIILGLVFVALVGFAAWLFMSDQQSSRRLGFQGGYVSVISTASADREFADLVEALGTARARESVIVTSPITDIVSEVYFDDGQRVKAGDILVRLTSTEEQEQLTEFEGNLVEAQANFERVEGLVRRGNAANALLEQAQRRLDESRSRVRAAKARLEDRIIRAPFDGLLGLRNVSPGSLVTNTTAITTMDKVDIVNLDFAVPERFISVLGAGQSVEATVDAFQGRAFEGKVKTIDSRVDPATRSVIVRAEIPNEDGLLRPGMLMRVTVTSRVWSAVAVREEAVVSQGGADYVFVVDGEAVERRRVTLGARVPGYVEVIEGLQSSERVVTEGTQRLGRPGIKVQDLAKDLASGPESAAPVQS